MQREDVERMLTPRLFLDGDGDLCCEREGHNLVACPAVSDEHPWPLLNADVWQNIPAMQEALRVLLDRAEKAEAERDAAFAAGQRDMQDRAIQDVAEWGCLFLGSGEDVTADVIDDLRDLPIKPSP